MLHSHSPASVLATMLDPSADVFKVTHLEMIKGIEGHGFYGECVVPIIENTARECELTDRLRAAIAAHPKSNAVLVRRHGVYVWGKDWIQAKTQAECYDYLFDAAVRMAAQHALLRITGSDLGYRFDDGPEARAAALARWQAWLQAYGSMR